LIRLLVHVKIEDTLYAELLGQEERGDVETVFDIHTGFQI
jgi:hypothetical protein